MLASPAMARARLASSSKETLTRFIAAVMLLSLPFQAAMVVLRVSTGTLGVSVPFGPRFEVYMDKNRSLSDN
jgi:hypothetical protein